MSYKIAISSNDGVYVNAHFGSSLFFYIVEVNDDGSYIYKEERIVPNLNIDQTIEYKILCGSKENSCENNSSCGNRFNSSCGNGNGMSCLSNIGGNSCGGGPYDIQIEQRVSLIEDCRCLLCKKIGPSAEKQLGRKAITTFQIDLKIDTALVKITEYYSKMDNHLSLRKE